MRDFFPALCSALPFRHSAPLHLYRSWSAHQKLLYGALNNIGPTCLQGSSFFTKRALTRCC